MGMICRAIAALISHLTMHAMQVRSIYWAARIRSTGGTVGRGFRAKRGVIFSWVRGAKINIGSRVCLGEDVHVFIGSEGKLELGDGVFVGRGSTLVSNAGLSIGAETQIAHYVTLIDTDHRFDDSTKPIVDQGQKTSPVAIGRDCWVGAHCVVLKGVSIQERAVIGAGSVVTKNVAARHVVAGNPIQDLRVLSP